MGIRRYRPNNAGRRNMSVSDFAELTKGAKPEKSLLRPKKRCSGRNNKGIITVRHRGGGLMIVLLPQPEGADTTITLPLVIYN